MDNARSRTLVTMVDARSRTARAAAGYYPYFWALTLVIVVVVVLVVVKGLTWANRRWDPTAPKGGTYAYIVFCDRLGKTEKA